MKHDEPIVMFGSPEAATRKTVEGWVSRDNRFFGEDERTARYSGCTHRTCETCEAIIPKSRTICDPCADAKRTAKYLTFPIVEWINGMAYDFRTDEWFSDMQAVVDHYEENEIDIAKAQLVASEPVYAEAPDPLDYYADELPEDGEVPDDVAVAFATLAETLKASRAALSWRPVDKRIVIAEVEV